MDSLESCMEMLSMDDDNKEERWIKHYSSNQKILLVGDGDFSFAVCLAEAFGSATNVVATSLYSEEMTRFKYSGAALNLLELEERGCTVMHEVNARTMNSDPRLTQKSFDRIVYNFPHAALKRSEANIRQIERHQRLVKSFLRSCRDMLEKNGEVHVTHKIKEPYCRWEIEKLAEDVGLCLVEKVLFRRSEYPGYSNKRGSGSRADETFPAGNSYTFKFARTT
ncbi:S-adenosyl-L-methionine-dependent methyltransferase [Salix suchowensis]|nr:S-adenosyl-L-methionine-dependent methyltransferase [Salix suchowensis]